MEPQNPQEGITIHLAPKHILYIVVAVICLVVEWFWPDFLVLLFWAFGTWVMLGSGLSYKPDPRKPIAGPIAKRRAVRASE